MRVVIVMVMMMLPGYMDMYVRLILTLGRKEVCQDAGNDDEDQADDYAGSVQCTGVTSQHGTCCRGGGHDELAVFLCCLYMTGCAQKIGDRGTYPFAIWMAVLRGETEGFEKVVVR